MHTPPGPGHGPPPAPTTGPTTPAVPHTPPHGTPVGGPAVPVTPAAPAATPAVPTAPTVLTTAPTAPPAVRTRPTPATHSNFVRSAIFGAGLLTAGAAGATYLVTHDWRRPGDIASASSTTPPPPQPAEGPEDEIVPSLEIKGFARINDAGDIVVELRREVFTISKKHGPGPQKPKITIIQLEPNEANFKKFKLELRFGGTLYTPDEFLFAKDSEGYEFDVDAFRR